MSAADQPLEVFLVCFDGHQRAGRVHRSLGEKITAGGGDVLSSTVLRVDDKGKARVYSPRRTLAGTLTPAVTWGVFGLITSGNVTSLVVWSLLGALLGGLYAYLTEHLLHKNDLARLGECLASDSSAILFFVVGTDSADLAAAGASFGAKPTSVATINSDLDVTVDHPSPANATGESLLSMLLFRYPGSDTAETVYAAAKDEKSATRSVVEIGSLIRAEPNGQLHVVNPTTGSWAFAKPDIVVWAGFGLIFGLIAGFEGGGDFFGILDVGLETAIAWGIFGAAAGGLYGLFAGRAVSARRLEAVGPLLPPNSSMIVAWAPGTPAPGAVDPWSVGGSEELVLEFVGSPPGVALRA